MKSINHCCASLCLVIVGLLFILPQPACADTYKISFLTSDQDYFFYGMDDMGTVVIEHPNSIPCDYSTCYFSFKNGMFIGISPVAPLIADDSGGECTPDVPSGGSVLHGICNNGREAFTGRLTSDQHFPDVYTGPDPLIDVAADSGEGFIFMNGRGDIVWDDHFSENWYEAIDLTSAVPEPASFLLLGTGLFSLAGLRRRFSIKDSSSY